MTAAPRYCSNCGNPLSPNAKFCASCGKAIQKSTAPLPTAISPQPRASASAAAPLPVPQAAPAAPTETIIRVISGANRHSGLLGLKAEPFVIVLTNARVIFAAQTAQMMKDNVQKARDAAKEEGKGFFGQWGAQLNANSGQQYYQMTPQHILAEQPANFCYYANQLRSIRLREDYNDESSVSTYTIEFDAPGGKHKFHLSHLDIRATKKLLQQYYGNIVR